MANDILPYARDLYMANLPTTEYLTKDISEVRTFPKADVLVGCYPCQGFSQGGARDPSRTVNYLYREFERALKAIRPKAFIVENVSGMRRADFKHLLQNQLVRFRLAGYSVTSSVLRASDFGVPQERARLFFVGIRSDLGVRYSFPSATHCSAEEQKNSLQRCPSLRDAIGDMPEWPHGEFDEQPFHWYYLSRNRYRHWNQISKTIVASSRHMPLHPVSPPLVRINTDKWVFSSDAPARRLSFREAAIIQGFPAEFTFPDSAGLRMKYRVIGNAVPPPLFREVARALPDIW